MNDAVQMRPLNCIQLRIISWMQEHRATSWVRVSGLQIYQVKPLTPRGLVQFEGVSGNYRARLTDAGRSFK